MTDNYEDIIGLPHYEPKNHPRMSMANRAAQFAPFAAITGHDAAIREASRQTDEQIQLSEEDNEELNRKMLMLREMLGEKPVVVVTYFQPDEKKAGGAYMTAEASLKDIDDIAQSIVLSNGQAISISTIIDIQIR